MMNDNQRQMAVGFGLLAVAGVLAGASLWYLNDIEEKLFPLPPKGGSALAAYLDGVSPEHMQRAFGAGTAGPDQTSYGPTEWAFRSPGGEVLKVYSRDGQFRIGANVDISRDELGTFIGWLNQRLSTVGGHAEWVQGTGGMSPTTGLTSPLASSSVAPSDPVARLFPDLSEAWLGEVRTWLDNPRVKAKAGKLARQFSHEQLVAALQSGSLADFAQDQVRGMTGTPDDGFNEALAVLLVRKAGLAP